MAKSTARHAREKRAILADQFNISAELSRRAGIVADAFSDGQELMEKGEHSVNKMYKLAIGDSRVGIHILVHKDLRKAIKAQAKAQGMTMDELLNATLTKIFW